MKNNEKESKQVTQVSQRDRAMPTLNLTLTLLSPFRFLVLPRCRAFS